MDYFFGDMDDGKKYIIEWEFEGTFLMIQINSFKNLKATQKHKTN